MPPLSSNRYCMQIGIYKTKEQYMHEKEMKKKDNGYAPQKLREQLQTFVESMAKGEQEKKNGPQTDKAYSHILVCPLLSMGYNLLMGGFKVLCPKDTFTFGYISNYMTGYYYKYLPHLCEMVNQDLVDDQKVNMRDFDPEEGKLLRITTYPQFKKIVIDDVEIMCDLLKQPKHTNGYEVQQRRSSEKEYVKPDDVCATTDSDKLRRIIQPYNYITTRLCFATRLLCKPLNTTAPPTSKPTSPSNTISKSTAVSKSNTANKVAKAVVATAVATAINHTLQQQNKQSKKE